jgi:PadR family transcriptional regulator AphA
MVLDHAILGFLCLRPLTGYKLKKSFDSSIRHFWTVDQSHIYRVLSRLSKDGYVTSELVPQQDKPNRKVYRITSEGRQEFLRWLISGEVKNVSIREPLLVRIFFAGLLSDKQALDILREEVACSSDCLSEYEEMSLRSLKRGEQNPSRDRFFQYLTLDYGLWMTRALLDWLGVSIDRVARGDPDSDDWSKTFPSMSHPWRPPPPYETGRPASDEKPAAAGGACAVSKTTEPT